MILREFFGLISFVGRLRKGRRSHIPSLRSSDRSGAVVRWRARWTREITNTTMLRTTGSHLLPTLLSLDLLSPMESNPSRLDSWFVPFLLFLPSRMIAFEADLCFFLSTVRTSLSSSSDFLCLLPLPRKRNRSLRCASFASSRPNAFDATRRKCSDLLFARSFSQIDQIAAKVSGMSLRIGPGSLNKVSLSFRDPLMRVEERISDATIFPSLVSQGTFVKLNQGPGAGEEYQISNPQANVNGLLKGT